MSKDDDNVIQGDFKKLDPPDIETVTNRQNDELPIEEAKKMGDAILDKKDDTTQLAISKQLNILPSTLETAAQSSMCLRDIQYRLANTLTSDNYLSLLASTAPDVLPGLLVSITSAINSADNLMIQMAKVAEKNASMNKVFEIMTKKQEAEKEQKIAEQKDEWYDDSVEKIKKAIYKRMDADRDSQKRTAQDYVDKEEVIIDADYIVQDETKDLDDE